MASNAAAQELGFSNLGPATYAIADSSAVVSPGLLIFEALVDNNIERMIGIAGSPERLRPHCKTHKTAAIIAKELKRGIEKHKCATFAEAEMLARAGVSDIFLAYNLVGPNIGRAVEFLHAYPTVDLKVTADHERPITALGEAVSSASREIGVLLDLDTGQHRTGVSAPERALALYRMIAETDGLRTAGLHVYDGQNHQQDLAERRQAVLECWQRALIISASLEAAALPVSRIVAGGTGSFPIFASIDDKRLELSPGTCVLHDAGYAQDFPDMQFDAAAVILTRVISRPTEDTVTLDLGYKACASDPPAGHRLLFPFISDAEEVLQNEEHLVIRTARANEFEPGDDVLAIPRHICPTSALHRQAYVIKEGKVADHWPIVARDRWLDI